MAAVISEGAPGAHHQLAEWLRAAVLGPRGGGTNRRRASDAFRLGLAVVVVAVSIPVKEGQLGGRAEHRARRASAARGDQRAGHHGLLDRSISDGTAAVVVMSAEAAERAGMRALAEIGTHGNVAGPDNSLHSQPSNAIRQAQPSPGGRYPTRT